MIIRCENPYCCNNYLAANGSFCNNCQLMDSCEALTKYRAAKELGTIDKQQPTAQSDAIAALHDLHAACLRADNAGELSELVDGKLMCRAKNVLLHAHV